MRFPDSESLHTSTAVDRHEDAMKNRVKGCCCFFALVSTDHEQLEQDRHHEKSFFIDPKE